MRADSTVGSRMSFLEIREFMTCGSIYQRDQREGPTHTHFTSLRRPGILEIVGQREKSEE